MHIFLAIKNSIGCGIPLESSQRNHFINESFHCTLIVNEQQCDESSLSAEWNVMLSI